ncbi:SH3 type 3 domain protein (fragment) [Magnetospirillum sp. LM-5]
MKLLLTVIVALSLAGPALAKTCTKGKPCGKSCIAVSKTCHK